MATQTFTDFDAFAGALCDVEGQLILSRRQVARWEHTHVQLNRVSVQCGHEGSGAIFQGAVRAGGCLLFVDTTRCTVHSANGRRLSHNDLTVIGSREICFSAPTANDWFSVFVPFDLLEDPTDLRQVLRDKPAGPLRIVHPSPGRLAHLAALVEVLESASRDRTWPADDPAIVAAAEANILTAALDCLGPPTPSPDDQGRLAVARGQIVRAALARLDSAEPEDHVPIPALADSVDVSERTLRTAFQDYFGMSPARYVRLRKLNLVRRALAGGNEPGDTVTQIESRFGVYEFGRFAHDYRSLFGEAPSETLRHRLGSPTAATQ